MRQTIIWSVAVVCAALILATGGMNAELTPIDESASSPKPRQVEVTNFPPVQRVNGRVAVRTFPSTQNPRCRSVASFAEDRPGRASNMPFEVRNSIF